MSDAATEPTALHAPSVVVPPRSAALRRAGAVGCAALLLGVSALASVGTAVPNPAKPTAGGYVEAALSLEADLSAEELDFGLGSGVVLVNDPVATVKTPPADLLTGTPVCASYPVAPGSFRLTSPYGFRVHPIFGTYSMHMGNDYAAPLGTPIHAVTDGTVVYTGAGRLGRSSELVIIEHVVGGTTFYSWYVHMYPEGIFVEVGQQVRAGEVIAEVGSNGNSTGPHLHFEIHTTDAGLGLQKNPVGRSTTSLLLPAPSPTDDETPAEEPTDDETPTEDPSEEPTDGETPTEDPSEEPTDGETPTEDPSEEPTDGETPTEEPTDGETPTEEPTPEPTAPVEKPSPTPMPDPSPAPAPSAEPGPTDEPSAEPTDEDGEEDGERTRNPFPVRAYGTTVDPVAFLASLGLTMVTPTQCTVR
ncbi:hypothetical protein FE251_12300 [Georgenia wutianyii]|uniref:M23ase beta-sheet core domain-containing protein n=1 Tax=Georgenia wutianyii TaxID=2585135 RepID=A0ABX5VNJ0_9MICO|nr:peptidoglycan DD-metalloendopeptidase family protein [Georgenia wutianyii]QDB80074.1 hypothetical protein FE251_12300 [Georgenia wutianyii]